MIGGRRPLKGRKLGDRRVRVERPHAAVLPLHGPGPARRQGGGATRRRRALGRAWARVRGVAIGRPLSSEEEIGERLSKKKALAIFSSDAISSSAYATEEILRVLVLAGAGAALAFSLEVAVAIAVLLAVVALSYRQVCRAYPSGGGAYAVVEGEPRRARRLDRGGGAAHRLRDDRRGLDGVGRRAGRLGRARARTTSRIEIARRRDRPDHDRQPPRPARVGQHLRDPDLPLRRARRC